MLGKRNVFHDHIEWLLPEIQGHKFDCMYHNIWEQTKRQTWFNFTKVTWRMRCSGWLCLCGVTAASFQNIFAIRGFPHYEPERKPWHVFSHINSRYWTQNQVHVITLKPLHLKWWILGLSNSSTAVSLFTKTLFAVCFFNNLKLGTTCTTAAW